MLTMRSYLNRPVELLVSGKKEPVRGILVDTGADILVVHDGSRFLYVPALHLQEFSLSTAIPGSDLSPAAFVWESSPDLSYRKVLMHSKGIFSEMYITGQQSIHGYVTSLMTDFFAFQSPVYHTVLVAMRHLKTLIPYGPNITPYSMNPAAFPVSPSTMPLSRTMDQQLKKLEGEFVVLNLGEKPNHIGLLKSVEPPIVELITSGGASVFMHIDHVKTLHKP
ncbi:MULTISPECIES: DUF2642 domain-containing protein [Paenibacillus]|uniref:DUF2642 domain-containing protein n=1 Tax=Paenibacillus TaxID=44249 RepID=UPI0022B93EB4|nr:DUF2642 domain-containing protein [Paenibacillus caseinilyticus]MCZ8519045.1 DUF2642 domain-containing protein [Paenibacillus caseinilyticus]